MDSSRFDLFGTGEVTRRALFLKTFGLVALFKNFNLSRVLYYYLSITGRVYHISLTLLKKQLKETKFVFKLLFLLRRCHRNAVSLTRCYKAQHTLNASLKEQSPKQESRLCCHFGNKTERCWRCISIIHFDLIRRFLPCEFAISCSACYHCLK